jgi:hypothetical protein
MQRHLLFERGAAGSAASCVSWVTDARKDAGNGVDAVAAVAAEAAEREGRIFFDSMARKQIRGKKRKRETLKTGWKFKLQSWAQPNYD